MSAELRLLDQRQAAEMLGLSVKTLEAWRWRGRGPRWRKIGGAVRYEPADLREFVDAAVRETSDSGGAAG